MFALVNALLDPVLRLLTAPLIVLTLGLFALVVNGASLPGHELISDSLHVDGFLTALAAALIISVVDATLELLLRVGRHSAHMS